MIVREGWMLSVRASSKATPMPTGGVPHGGEGAVEVAAAIAESIAPGHRRR